MILTVTAMILNTIFNGDFSYLIVFVGDLVLIGELTLISKNTSK